VQSVLALCICLFFLLETYCGATRAAGRRVRDEAVAVRRSGLSDLEIEAMLL